MLLAIGRMVAEKSMIAWPLQSIFILSILYSRDINNHETPPDPRDKIPRSISSEYTQITFLPAAQRLSLIVRQVLLRKMTFITSSHGIFI